MRAVTYAINDCQVNVRHPLPEEAYNSCSSVVPKLLPVFEQPPVLLREILTSNSRQGKHFSNNTLYDNVIVRWQWLQFELIFPGRYRSRKNAS